MGSAFKGRGWIVALVVAFLGAGHVAVSRGAQAVTDGRVIGLDHVGRMVSDLDRSLRFYTTLGFVQDAGVDGSWHQDAALDRLLGTKGAQTREARLVLNSNLSGQPFALVLMQLRGVPRKVLSGYVPWEPGASHFGMVVPDAPALWARLKAEGQLWARSWGAELIPFPGQTTGALAYLTDPDGLDIELINQRPAAPAQDGRPANPGSPPGFNHIGLVVLDSDKARAFYETVLGGKVRTTEAPWVSGDFYDSVVGGHGNILRFYNEVYPEVAAPQHSMAFELVEFQNRKKPVTTYSLADVGVGYLALQVEGLDQLLSRATDAQAKMVSAGGIVKLKDGTRAVFIRDPDVGGFVELFEPPRH